MAKRQKTGLALQAERADLLEALAAATKVVAPNVVRPIFSCVHLASEQDGLVLTAGDLDTTVRVTAPCEVTEEGAAAVPARILQEAVKRCGTGKVTLRAGQDGKAGQVLTLTWGQTKLKIAGLDPADFQHPTWPSEWRESPELLEAVRCVVAAAEDRAVQAMLRSVHLSDAGAVATDGFRVAHLTAGGGFGVGQDGVVLPAQALRLFAAMAPDGATVGTARDDARVFLHAGPVTMASRVYAGKYPAVLSMLPGESDLAVTVGRKALLDAARRMALIVEHKAPHVLMLEPRDGTLRLSARDGDVGEGFEDLEAEIKGKPYRLGLNALHVVEGLHALQGERVTIKMSGPERATRWDDGGSLVYWEMPLQLRGEDEEAEPEAAAEPSAHAPAETSGAGAAEADKAGAAEEPQVDAQDDDEEPDDVLDDGEEQDEVPEDDEPAAAEA